MATETIAGPYGEVRAASTAGGGTALTSTAARIVLPFGTKHIDLVPRNFSTAVVVQWLKNPWLHILETRDDHATFNDRSYVVQNINGEGANDFDSLGTLAQGDALYIGSHVPFSGVDVSIDSANGTASVLTVSYWDGDSWADTSATDGTDSGGATLAQSGAVTWSVPSDWASAKLNQIVAATDNNLGAYGEVFWTRWTVSAALDASVTVLTMIAITVRPPTTRFPAGWRGRNR